METDPLRDRVKEICWRERGGIECGDGPFERLSEGDLLTFESGSTHYQLFFSQLYARLVYVTVVQRFLRRHIYLETRAKGC